MSQHQLKLIAEKANNCIKDLIIKRAISANSNFRISLSRLFAAEIKIGIYFNEIVGIANMGSENRTNICWSYWRSNMQWIIIIHFQIRMPFFWKQKQTNRYSPPWWLAFHAFPSKRIRRLYWDCVCVCNFPWL